MTIPLQPPDNFYCSQLALENEEMMAGTAVSAPVWVLLEYRQVWQAKATEDNTLPASVKVWLEEGLGLVNGRLQFIRQTPYSDRYTCFVSIPDAQTPRLYRFGFSEYEELLTIDLTALVKNASQYAPYLTTEPLFLVCTNGKRDRCCARLGTVLYKALVDRVKTAVWQTTHLGGHRFAPTLISFPEGVSYGHITVADIPPLLSAQKNGELYLSKLRGRAIYDAVTQVAEYFLCQESGESGLATFKHLGTQSPQENEWSVQFQHTQTGHVSQIELTQGEIKSVYASCGSSKIKLVPTYQFSRFFDLNTM